MHFDGWKLAVVAAFAIGGMGAAHAPECNRAASAAGGNDGAPTHDWRTGGAGEVG
jgi:hypothetical protein